MKAKPSPYNADAKKCLSTHGDDRHGKPGHWISICGEWVRLERNEVFRLHKKWKQARELRTQFEQEIS